ncbi:unnamed protein product, partial [Iphiclides podalirius]
MAASPTGRCRCPIPHSRGAALADLADSRRPSSVRDSRDPAPALCQESRSADANLARLARVHVNCPWGPSDLSDLVATYRKHKAAVHGRDILEPVRPCECTRDGRKNPRSIAPLISGQTYHYPIIIILASFAPRRARLLGPPISANLLRSMGLGHPMLAKAATAEHPQEFKQPDAYVKLRCVCALRVSGGHWAPLSAGCLVVARNFTNSSLA